MSTREIEEAEKRRGQDVQSILKRNGVSQKMNGTKGFTDHFHVKDRSRSTSDPIETSVQTIQRKTNVINVRKDSLQVKSTPIKSGIQNHTRFGEIIEIDDEIDYDHSVLDEDCVSQGNSSIQSGDEHFKENVEPITYEAVREMKEMTMSEILQQLKRIIVINRNQICENLVLLILVLLMLVPSILFAIFNEPDDPYQFAMTSYATVWPLKQQFVLYQGGKNNGLQLTVNWGNTIPHLSGVPTMCKNKKPWCYSWSQNSLLLLTPLEPSAGIDCVRFDWQNLTSQPIQFSDCFVAYNESSYWYGGPAGINTVWPANDQPATEFINILTGDVQTSFQNLYGVQEPFWVSNDGFAVLISKRFSVSVNQNKSEICINSDPYVGRLQYAVCRGSDPTSLVLQRETMEKVFDTNPSNASSIEDGVQLEPDQANFRNETLFNIIVALDATNLLNEPISGLIETLSEYNLSFIVMFENFDFFDVEMSSQLIQILKDTNLSSYYPTAIEASNYVKADNGDFDMKFWEALCVTQKANGAQNPNAPNPIGTIIWRGHLYFVIDFTRITVQEQFKNATSVQPIMDLVQYLAFTGGGAAELPVQAQFNITDDNWNVYSTMFVESVATSPNLISVATGYKTQQLKNLHIDIPVTPFNITIVIPVFLTLNIQGYSYLSLHLFDPSSTSVNFDYSVTNSSKLVAQWLQLAMYMPVFRVPFELMQTDAFKDAYDKYGFIRRETVLPHYLNASVMHKLHGQPILKPMWWFGDNQHDAWINNNQFMIGDNLLVAAFLSKHNFKVYLPNGAWQDPNVPSVCHTGGGVVALHNPVDIMCFERVLNPDICLYN